MPIVMPAILALALLLGTSEAQAASAREVFEKYGLTGTFAPDCSQPPSQQNAYVVHRVLDAERVQRDFMVDASKSSQSVFASVSELRRNEIMVRLLTADGQRHTDIVYRVEGRRFRTIQSTRDDGIKVVVDGRAVQNGLEIPWRSKCG